ncbi:MAG: glycosyltransferase family 2 protein [Gemmatimonadetes bacterium]|nr:glycosyltransferase family 2 protein [Gemmatimonadota bacterium]
MTWFAIMLACAGIPVLAASLYLFGLTLLARTTGRPLLPVVLMRRRFVIVVPAHNEAAGLGRTLTELERLTWRRDLWRVVVVADNCTDDTAGVAARHGAAVIVRDDPTRRGKGFALDYAFRSLLNEPTSSWHAAVVVDADTIVAPNLLEACSAQFNAGARAVQAAYLAFPGTGPLSVITQVALTAIHVVRSTARERLGLSAGLRGNGMAFTRLLLSSTPHAAYTRTEDLEFGVQLALKGVRVAFAGDTAVWGEMPTSASVATHQRERWIGGRMEISRRYLRRLLRSAFRKRSMMMADVAVDLMVPPISVLAIAIAGGVVLSAGALFAGQWVALAVWGTALFALAGHVLDAAQRANRLGDLLSLVGAVPAYAFDKLKITLRAPAQFGGVWVRTARQGEAA